MGKFIIVPSRTNVDIEFTTTKTEAQDMIEKYGRENPNNSVSFKILPYSKKLIEHYLKIGYDVGETFNKLDEVI